MSPLRIPLYAGALALTAAYAVGQLGVTVSTDRKKYIRYEPINLGITLRNNSGHALDFGTTPDTGGYLRFQIRHRRGEHQLKEVKGLNPVENLVLPAGGTKSIDISISNFFQFHSPDDYVLVARIGHRRLKHDFESSPVKFQVSGGVNVWHREVGVPTQDLNETIPVRKCSINTFHSDAGDLYYLQIEDDEFVYAVVRLGPRVQGILPQCDIDAMSRIHVLIQTAPRMFRHNVFNLSGSLRQSAVYIIENNVPRLLRSPDVGRVMVSGGKKAVEGIDYNIRSVPVMPMREDLPAAEE